MSLRMAAIQLSGILNEISATASNSPFAHVTELGREMAQDLARYDKAVFELHSREAASDALEDLADRVNHPSAASTRGELAIFEGDVLDSYWHLRTIFWETKYHDQML